MNKKAATPAQEYKKSDNIVDNKELINIYYSALMIYLVFTFADKLLQDLLGHYDIPELWLFAGMWVSLVIQTTYAYKHIISIEDDKYTMLALMSDGIDICIEIVVCAVISNTFKTGEYIAIENYWRLSIPFMLMAVNQFCWYIIIDKFNARAILCLSMLCVGMLAITIWEGIYHSIWSLVIIVVLHSTFMAIWRIVDKVPKSFEVKAELWWGKITQSKLIRKLHTHIEKRIREDEIIKEQVQQ